MCSDWTHPEALRATGNEREQVVCVPLTAPALGSRGQRCSWSFSPCKGCSPGSTQLLMLAGSNTPWPSSELCSNPMALLCQLVLFPREKLFLWLIAGAAFPSPAAEHLPLAWWKAAQRGSVGSTGGRSWHNTAPTAAPELWQSTRVKTSSPLIGEKQFCL